MSPSIETKPVELTGMQAVEDLVRRAQEGDVAVLPMLKKWLDDNPQVWKKAGDLAWHAEEAVLGLAAGDNHLLRESIRRKMTELKAELSGSSPSPLEKLLVDRIVISWAQLHHADLDAVTKDRGATPLAAHVQRRQNAAHQRYLTAVRQLATVRRLLQRTPTALDLLTPVSETNGKPQSRRFRLAPVPSGAGRN